MQVSCEIIDYAAGIQMKPKLHEEDLHWNYEMIQKKFCDEFMGHEYLVTMRIESMPIQWIELIDSGVDPLNAFQSQMKDISPLSVWQCFPRLPQ